MNAVTCCNGTLSLADRAVPQRASGEVLIRVAKAGICTTDIEIVKGYTAGFCGVLGHEFFGFIEDADDPTLIGKRATAEINCACGSCALCASGLGRHCTNRTVIGIVKRDGCFADYIAVPIKNVVVIPDIVPETSAVLIEPLAAALEIFDQIPLSAEHETLLIGDGRLAQLIANVFICKDYPLTVVGKHETKLAHLRKRGLPVKLLPEFSPSPFDIVIEASGSPSGLALAIASVKPRGTIVLKSTYAGDFPFNPAPIIVNEITVVGSRCGRFDDALRFLLNYHPDLSYMISARYPLAKALSAFEKAKAKDVLKVVLEME
jgi:threonine dehydrogenase-like Zn-dependent dehydrogenase